MNYDEDGRSGISISGKAKTLAATLLPTAWLCYVCLTLTTHTLHYVTTHTHTTLHMICLELTTHTTLSYVCTHFYGSPQRIDHTLLDPVGYLDTLIQLVGLMHQKATISHT